MIKLTLLPNTKLNERLAKLYKPPKQLFCESHCDLEELIKKPCVAIVGSRKMTTYGRIVTETIAGELSRRGICIISGLAYGVDITAHKAALRAGGHTIAVLPSPLDSVYPRGHAQIAKDIVARGGALLSEYPNGSQMGKHTFIERNRIIASLADLVLLPESAEKSGSLHTASFALECGILIGAVPGPITSQLSMGSNKLLQHGAHVILTARDVLDLLGIDNDESAQTKLFADTEEQLRLLGLLSEGVQDAEELQRRSKLTASNFQQALTMLEIDGKISAMGMNKWRIGS
jgi:DNA processing protein